MKSIYKRLGDYITPVDEFNTGLKVKELLGISNNKYFQKSHTNTIGIDLSNYRVVRNNHFAFNRATTRNGDKISIALKQGGDCIVSPSYRIFRSTDESELNSEYLWMWFRRPEFDRYARFKSHGSAHEFFDMEEMNEVMLPIPHINKQREIVKEYNTIQNRNTLNQQLIQKLEETAQAIYKEWFVEFEFPNETGKPYKSSGGEMVWDEQLETEFPKGWKYGNLAELVSPKHQITYGVVKPGDEDNNGVKFIRSGDIRNGEILFSQLRTISAEISNQFKRTKLEGGEILISIVGNPGQVAIVPFFLKGANIARQVAMVKVDNVDFQLFIKNQMISQEGQKALREITIGSVQDVINLEDLRLLRIIIPDVKVLNVYNKLARNLEENLQQKYLEVQKLIELKELLLSKLATI